jgi:hypothetical protein
MLRLLPAGLWQLRVVVSNIKPLDLPVLVRVDELVCQVLVGGIFTHLDSGSSDYSRVIGARLRLQAQEFLKQDPVGLDLQEGFTEVDEDRDVKMPLGFKFKYSIP